MSSSQNGLRRLGSAAGRLYLLVAVGLGVVVSAIDPQAGYHTPWHDHIVVGAHGLKEWAHAVAVHRHTGEGWKALGEAAPHPSSGIAPQDRPRVLSIARSPDGAGASVIDLNSQVPSGRGPIEGLLLPPRWERFLPPVIHALRPRVIPVPEPPPRVSS